VKRAVLLRQLAERVTLPEELESRRKLFATLISDVECGMRVGQLMANFNDLRRSDRAKEAAEAAAEAAAATKPVAPESTPGRDAPAAVRLFAPAEKSLQLGRNEQMARAELRRQASSNAAPAAAAAGPSTRRVQQQQQSTSPGRLSDAALATSPGRLSVAAQRPFALGYVRTSAQAQFGVAQQGVSPGVASSGGRTDAALTSGGASAGSAASGSRVQAGAPCKPINEASAAAPQVRPRR
jgi:hypothetical protein